MKTLLTGGAGFIGSHLSKRLLKNGMEVLIIDDFNDYYDPQIKYRNIDEIKRVSTGVKVEELDIRDYDRLREVWQSFMPELVIHLAARAGVRPSLKDPVLYHQVNVQGTLNLLELARRYEPLKFIFASSSSVYGTSKRLPFSEDDPLDSPASPYAVTKIAGENICRVYSKVYGIPIVCLRFFTVYGPGQRPEMAIHKFTRKIMNDEPIPMYGDGSSARDYTYIDDIINGIWNVINLNFEFDIFNLGDSKPIRLKELIHLLEMTIKKRAKIQQLPDQPGDVPITYADISKAKKSFGYAPEVPIEEGLKRFLDWYVSWKS